MVRLSLHPLFAHAHLTAPCPSPDPVFDCMGYTFAASPPLHLSLFTAACCRCQIKCATIWVIPHSGMIASPSRVGFAHASSRCVARPRSADELSVTFARPGHSFDVAKFWRDTSKRYADAQHAVAFSASRMAAAAKGKEATAAESTANSPCLTSVNVCGLHQ